MQQIVEMILKVPKYIYKILCLFLLLIDAIGFNLSTTMEKIEIFDIAAWYKSLVLICPPITKIAQDYRSLFLILTVVLIILLIYKPRFILIKHISFSPDIVSIDKGIVKKYRVKKIEINQCEKMKTEDTITDAIVEQDQILETILKMRKSDEFCYYGIAHTPLIFRLGFNMGDQSQIRLLHKKRSNDSVFEEWSRDIVHTTMGTKESNKTIESNELIVAISTTFEIKDNELRKLNSDKKHIVKFECTNMSFDSVLSYNQAENYRNQIMIKLRECVKKYGIQKIHLVISSSVAFTFFMGQAFSAQHDPVTIVYHYQNGEYPWGICMNAQPNKALVLVE